MTYFVLKTVLGAVIAPFVLSACASAAPNQAAPSSEKASAETLDTPTKSHAVAPSAADIDDGEPRPYDETRDAQADVDAALFAAQTGKKNAIIVMGANWCHDSRALAGHFMTPRFQTLFADNYEVVYVDMGIKNRNLDIASQFGVKKVEGTPTVIVTNLNGKVLNGDTAKTWRNAAERTEDAIYEEFLSFAPKPESL